MTLAIARAELRYQLGAVRTWVTSAVLFGICFLQMANAGEFEAFAPGGTVMANAPFAITELLITLTVFCVFAVPAFLGDAALRDTSYRFDGILFATPVRKSSYLLGRFAGAYAALLVALAGAPVGMLLGTFWPWTDRSLIGPTHLDHYLIIFTLAVALPMLTVAAITFSVAVITRSTVMTFVAILCLQVFYLVTGELNVFPPIVDPFLYEVFDAETRYWTAAERNTRLLTLTGAVLTSRLVWAAVAAVLFFVAYRAFSFRVPRRKPPLAAETSSPPSVASRAPVPGAQPAPEWSLATPARQLWVRTVFEVKAVIASLPFAFVLVLGSALVAVQLAHREILYGVDAIPVTRLMLADLLPLVLAVMVVLVFYSAEVVWRERSHGMHEIIDAAPISDAVLAGSKMVALAVVVVAMQLLGVGIAVGLQLLHGHQDLELGLHLERGFFFRLVPFLCLIVLTCFFQVVSGKRYVGMLCFAVFLGGMVASHDLLGVEHPLVSFVFPDVAAPLSGLNGTGRFGAFAYWLRAYWVSIAGLLLLVTYLLFPRGTLQPMRYRLRRLRALRTPGYAAVGTVFLLGLLTTGGFVLYNTNVVATYHSRGEVETKRATYEKRFRTAEDLPMPRVVDVRVAVDLYPYTQRVEVDSTQVLENKTDRPISIVHVVFPPGLRLAHVTLEGAPAGRVDETLVPYYVFELETPMLPGDRRTLAYEAQIEHRGFPHRRPDTGLVRNGTFLVNDRLVPSIGFEREYVIRNAKTRAEHGLDPLPRRPKLEDTREHHYNASRRDSDFLSFEATISTAIDQTAITLGERERTWTQGDRRFFQYQMKTPVRHFFPIVSARYQVVRDRWRDVEIEVFHHPGHEGNVHRMIEAIQDSLTVYTELFGPYPFDHVRIAETPSYRAVAQAFAGTIAFSEDMGFLADVGPEDIDVPYYVTAHEMAHMWWGHVVAAANVQGDRFVHETLAQYGALRVLERRYGTAAMRRFLKLELDRYLAGRGEDSGGELPLIREERQAYIYYRKGSVVMMAARDYLGANVLDRALRRFVALRGFETRPYATSIDFLDLLKREADPAHHGWIEDWFEKITIYDLEVTRSTVREREDGRFDVRIDVAVAKGYADADGTETPAVFDVPVELGVFAADPDDPVFGPQDVLALERRLLGDGTGSVTVVVDRAPSFVGIDPFCKLIDRDTEDNVRAVGDLRKRRAG